QSDRDSYGRHRHPAYRKARPGHHAGRTNASSSGKLSPTVLEAVSIRDASETKRPAASRPLYNWTDNDIGAALRQLKYLEKVRSPYGLHLSPQTPCARRHSAIRRKHRVD